MLEFTSALYLGLQHPSRSLQPWERLTTGAPAALVEPTKAREICRALAALMGFEAAMLAPSTFHLAWDLFGLLAEKPITILMDAGAYPITRWGVQRAAMRGAKVRSLPHHNVHALERELASMPHRRLPVIVTDGFCPSCGRVAPLAEYHALAQSHRGLLVVDDTQAFGVIGDTQNRRNPYGRSGGGSLRWSGVNGPNVLVFNSLAKGFGVPIAVLAGSAAAIRHFEEKSLTRVHCSPPSTAVISAALHAIEVNHKWGDALRRRLAQVVSRFREGVQALGIIVRGGLFPVQTLALPPHFNAAIFHGELDRRGVRAVLQKGRGDAGPQVTFLLNARQALSTIHRAVAIIARSLHSLGQRQDCKASLWDAISSQKQPSHQLSEPSRFAETAHSTRIVRRSTHEGPVCE